MSDGDGAATQRWRRVLRVTARWALALALLEAGARVLEAVESVPPDLADADVADLRQRAERGEFDRRPGEKLVYVYGESTVWGVPCPEIGLVEQMRFLACRSAAGPPVRIVNAGVRSADSTILRSVVEETIGRRPDLAIVLCGHNEFVRPDAAEIRAAGTARQAAAVRVGARLASRVARAWRTRGVPEGFEAPFARDDAPYRRAAKRFRENMDAIVAAADDAGVPAILAALPSNLSEWPPVFRRVAGSPDGYQDAMDEGLDADERRDTPALRRIVERWYTRSPDDPMVRFLRGRLRLAHGDPDGALEDFRFARDADPIPCRMPSQFMTDVRDVAARRSARFADLESALAGGGGPGLDLFVDNCHPSPDGGHRMAAALVGLVRGDSEPARAAVQASLDEFLGAAGYTTGSELRLRYLVANGQYAMRRPVYHYPIARRYLMTALAEYPGSWLAHANFATLLLFLGDTDGGRRELELARKLHEGPIDLSDRESVPYLGEAMALRGVR